MRSLARCTAAVLIASILAIPLSAQRQRPTLDGAWRHLGRQVVAPDSSFRTPALQGMAVVSGRSFSQIWVIPAQSGVQQASQPSTVDEKAARYDMLIANAGTLDIGDSVITFHYTQAKNPRVVGTSATRRYRVKGDTSWYMGQSPWAKDSTKMVRFTDTYVRIGAGAP